MAEQKRVPAKFKREVNREMRGRTSQFKGAARRDSTTDQLHGGSPFSKGTAKRLKHETKDSMCKSVKPLPKNDDSMTGMLNNDQRSDRNLPEKMPRVNIHQGRNDEHMKYNDDLGSGISDRAELE